MQNGSTALSTVHQQGRHHLLTIPVNSARNKDIWNVLSVYFTDRLTDFRTTLHSDATSSNIIQNSYCKSGPLYNRQQSGHVYLQSTSTPTVNRQTATAWFRFAGFTVCKLRKLYHSPRVNSKHDLHLHHTHSPFKLKDSLFNYIMT
jgi:hypothetical protein